MGPFCPIFCRFFNISVQRFSGFFSPFEKKFEKNGQIWDFN
jgi:hypothetical protein